MLAQRLVLGLSLALLMTGVSTAMAFGAGGGGSVPVRGDEVLLRQARESLDSQSVSDVGGAAEFGGLGDGAALALMRSAFDGVVGEPAWSWPVLRGSDRVLGFASDSTLVVDGPGGRSLVSSLLPLRSPDGSSGAKQPLSTDLQRVASGFAPDNALVGVSIPTDLADGVDFTRIGVAVVPVGSGAADGVRVGTDKVFYGNALRDTDVVVAALPSGVETFTQIRSKDSPAEQGLRFVLPPGASLQVSPDGAGAEVVRGGSVIARVSPAAAVDANGVQVPVSMSVDGDVVSLKVDDSKSGLEYPILLDPTISVDSRLWDVPVSGLSLGGWQYRTTNWNLFSSSTSGAWGPGLYSLVHAGSIGANDSGEWRYTAPGDARIFGVSFGPPATRVPNPANGFAPICTSQGLLSASGMWEPGSGWSSGSASGLGPRTVCQGATVSETPVFCATAPCSTLPATPAGSAGNAALNTQWAYGAGTRLKYNNDINGVSEYDYIGAAYVSIADDKPPTVGVTHSTPVPDGWVNHYTDTVTIGGNDSGTGIWHLTLKDHTPEGTDVTLQDQGYFCDGSRTVPCAASWNSTNEWPAKQSFTYNTDNLTEGQHTLTATARDRTGSSSTPIT